MTLQPTSVLAVRVPGYPKGREVWMDADGHARCVHGFTESTLARAHRRRRHHAASTLQDWWRRLAGTERASVRAALLHPRDATPSDELERAATIWRRCSERRREVQQNGGEEATSGAQPSGGRHKRRRPSCKPSPEPCGCRPDGLRREIFGTMQRDQAAQRAWQAQYAAAKRLRCGECVDVSAAVATRDRATFAELSNQ